MVDRRLNKPVIKIQNFPVFWLRAIGAEWNCRLCQKPQPAKTVSMELTVRHASSGVKGQGIPIKLYLCLPCAEKLLQESLEKVQLCKAVGEDAYKLFTTL